VEIAEAHGWDVHTTEGTEGGARFEIRDIRSLREDDTDGRFQATSSRTPRFVVSRLPIDNHYCAFRQSLSPWSGSQSDTSMRPCWPHSFNCSDVCLGLHAGPAQGCGGGWLGRTHRRGSANFQLVHTC
jgi:hypothetical protein